MKGIDIIELLRDIDDDMILHARHHRKSTPVWLRWASAAAVLLCAVILLAVMLAKLLGGPTGTNPDPNVPDVLAPGLEEPPAGPPAPSPAQAAYVAIPSPADGTILYVPEAYRDEFSTESDYSYFTETTGETFQFEDGIFYFFDTSQQAYGRDGLVWVIESQAADADSLEQILENDRQFGSLCFLVNNHILGTKGDRLYSMVCLQPRMEKEDSDGGTYFSSERCRMDNGPHQRSYYEHMEAGLHVLRDFVEKNGLEPVEGAVDWEAWYRENIMEDMDVSSAEVQHDVLHDEARVSVAGVTFGMNDTDVLALLGEPDSAQDYDTEGGKCRELVYFGTISCYFQECATCGEYHLRSISERSGGSRLLPFGITLEDTLADVLSALGAEALNLSVRQRIYTWDDSHYADYEVAYNDSPSRGIRVHIGEILWEMTFAQGEQLTINSVSIPPEYDLHSVHTWLAERS